MDEVETVYGTPTHFLIDNTEDPYNPEEAYYYLERIANDLGVKLTNKDYITFDNIFKREVKPFVDYKNSFWAINEHWDRYLLAIGDAVFYTLKDKVPKGRKFYYC